MQTNLIRQESTNGYHLLSELLKSYIMIDVSNHHISTVYSFHSHVVSVVILHKLSWHHDKNITLDEAKFSLLYKSIPENENSELS